MSAASAAQPVRIVLVGVGGYGEAYLREVLDAGAARGVELVGAADPEPERCEGLGELRRREVPLYPTLSEFYREREADLAVISAPIHLHAPLTCEALEHGSHVLCEKPLAATAQDGLRMAAAAAAAGRSVAIGYQWSYSDAIQAFKGDVMAGRFGRPVRLRTVALWPRREPYYRRNRWAGARKSAGGAWVLDSPANNATSHFLHNMFYVLGETRETSARPVEIQAELYRAKPIENYDTAALRCRTASGVEILFYTTHSVAESRGPVSCFEFEEATVTYDENHGQDLVARFRDGAEQSYGNPQDGRMNKLWESVAAVRSGGPMACPVEAALSQTVCVNGAHESVPEIAPFPAELVQATESDEGRLVWVAGLYEALLDCYERGVLPAEHGALSWARPGRTVDLHAYRTFPSRGASSA